MGRSSDIRVNPGRGLNFGIGGSFLSPIYLEEKETRNHVKKGKKETKTIAHTFLEGPAHNSHFFLLFLSNCHEEVCTLANHASIVC